MKEHRREVVVYDDGSDQSLDVQLGTTACKYIMRTFQSGVHLNLIFLLVFRI